MYAPNSALLNALAHHKINFKQVLKFIDARYDFEPTAFQNGSVKNAAGENQGSCKVFCFAHLNNFNQLDTLALFAEHYQSVKDNPDGTDHQNIRQFIYHGWAGVHFEGHALTPKANMDEINAQAAQLYADSGSEFEEIAAAETSNQQPVDAQPGAEPVLNESSDKLSENMENFAQPSAPKNADGSVDTSSGTSNVSSDSQSEVGNSVPEQLDTTDVKPDSKNLDNNNLDNNSVDNKSPGNSNLDEEKLDEKAEQAVKEAEDARHNIVPPSPGSSGSMATETTYYTDNDSVANHTATPEPEPTETISPDSTASSTPQASTESKSNLTQDTNASSANTSASELAQTNDNDIADNPAAFINDQPDSHDTSVAHSVGTEQSTSNNTASATSTQHASTATTETKSAETDHVGTSGANQHDGGDASVQASASASDIVAGNASHIADNPAEFIDEKNTSTDADEPATGAEDNTHAKSAVDNITTAPDHNDPDNVNSDESGVNPSPTEKSDISDGHGSANPSTDSVRDGEFTEKVRSPENQQNGKI